MSEYLLISRLSKNGEKYVFNDTNCIGRMYDIPDFGIGEVVTFRCTNNEKEGLGLDYQEECLDITGQVTSLFESLEGKVISITIKNDTYYFEKI